MSSSKILRSCDWQRPYALEPLGELPPPAESEPFRPVQLGIVEPEPELEPELEPEPEPPAPPMMLEEEALARIEQAHVEGVAEGRAQAEEEFAALSRALGEALAQAGELRGRVMQEAEEDLLRLSVLIARRVMLREFACDPAVLAGVVRHAVELASEPGEVVVRLNPDEHLLVSQSWQFQALLKENPRILLKPDQAVGRAGCLVETTRGTIDASADSQLDEILRRLTEERSAHREEPEYLEPPREEPEHLEPQGEEPEFGEPEFGEPQREEPEHD
jgi:flagellar assembly protein FliH